MKNRYGKFSRHQSCAKEGREMGERTEEKTEKKIDKKNLTRDDEEYYSSGIIQERAARRRKKEKERKKRKIGLLLLLLVAGITVWLVWHGNATQNGYEEKTMGQELAAETESVTGAETEGSDSSGEKVRAKNDGSYAGSIAHDDAFWEGAPEIESHMLTPNSYSRPQLLLREINSIVIHYTADPGAEAINVRNYFEKLAETGETHASSHFIVGLKGEIIQCIPCSEQSYASNGRNKDTLSIEICHPDESGKFNTETYDSAVDLTAWLCKAFAVEPDKIIRHYDVTGKSCPKWFVDDPEAWAQYKADVAVRYEQISQ